MDVVHSLFKLSSSAAVCAKMTFCSTSISLKKRRYDTHRDRQNTQNTGLLGTLFLSIYYCFWDILLG